MMTSQHPILAAADVGGTSIKIGLFTNGQEPDLLCQSAVPTRTEDHGRSILPDLTAEIRRLVEEKGLSMEQISGIGIGVPGPVIAGPDEEQLVNRCVNLNWDSVVDVAREVRSLMRTGRDGQDAGAGDVPCPISIMNDANAAALGELYFGTGLPMERLKRLSAVMITLGTGIGGGIIRRGSIVEGAFGAAGEIGHMPILPTHPLLKEVTDDMAFAGSHDLEYYASATGIARMADALLRVSDQPSRLREADPADARAVFDAAKEGDGLACRVTDFFFDTLGAGMACIASVIDPDLFIIGGGVVGAGEYLLDGVRRSYRKSVFHASRDTEIRLASLGNYAGLVGTIVPLLR